MAEEYKNMVYLPTNIKFCFSNLQAQIAQPLLLTYMQEQIEQLPAHIIKNLLDRNPDKRESAGRQLEIIVAKSIECKNIVHVERIINEITQKYIKSQALSNKRAGLESFTWIAQGLKDFPDEAGKLIESIVRPVLECFGDADQKTKYTAIKSLYYICKFLQQLTIKGVLIKMSDTDQQIKRAAQLLNGTLKTIISDALSDNIQFQLARFMGVLTEHLKDTSSTVRQFLIDWINTVDEVPSMDLSVYLPCFLEDVLFMLGDKEKQLRSKAEQCLKAFLYDLKEKFFCGKLQQSMSEENISQLITILINVCKGKFSAYSKLTAIVWLQGLFTFFREQVEQKTRIKHKFFLKKIILDRFDQILEPILCLLSFQEEQVRKAAASVNQQLLQITQILKKQQTINFNKVMPLLKHMLCERKSSTTSESVLTWMKFLLQNYNDKILPEINDIIQKLVEQLCDGSTKNVMGIIENVSLNEQYFDLVIERLLNLLFQNKAIDFRTQEVLRKFCDMLDPEKTYMSICVQLLTYDHDAKFIETIVDSLGLLLATQRSLVPIRQKLRRLNEPQTRKLFEVLYKAFSYNTVAVLTLCYLSQQYQLAYQIILSVSRQPMTCSLITNLCHFVNFFESPSFLCLRLQMLERSSFPYLVESIYALMMLLPQGKVYTILKNRIDTVNHVKTNLKSSRQMKIYRLHVKEFLDIYENTRKKHE